MLRVRSAQPRNHGVAALEAVIADLAGLNRKTEGHFLSVAGRLTELLTAATRISTEVEAVVELVSGNQSNGAANSLTGALAGSREMQQQAQAANTELAELHRAAGRLGSAFTGLARAESSFGMLATLTRVETARLGGAGSEFGNLADDVKALAGKIQARVETAVEAAGELGKSIAGTLASLAEAGDRNAQDLPTVIGDITNTLDSIGSGQQRAHEASQRLHCQYAEVSQSVRELVVSIQFQDITRQQVEHVIEALQQLCSQARAGGSRNPGLPARAGAILQLQSAQLAHAGGAFARSVAQIQSNLGRIAGQVEQMSEQTQALAGSFENEQASYFVDVEHGCSAILGGIRICSQARTRIESAAGALSETIGQVRAIVEDLQGIDIQMQRLSLNAIIRAVHIGDAGSALGVVAGAMQRLAGDSSARSGEAVALIEAMHAGAARLTAGSRQDAATQQDLFLEQMRVAIETLHSASERSFARIQTVQELGSRLCQDLVTTRENFTPGELFREAVERARIALAEAAADLDATAANDGELRTDLDDLGARYTMKAERDVHQAASEAGASEQAPALAGPEAPEDDMGGTVEFF